METIEQENQGGNADLLALADEFDASENAVNLEKTEEATAAAVEQNAPALEIAKQILTKFISGAVELGAQKFIGLRAIWNEEVIENTANAAAVLLVKYDVSAPEFVGKYAEELQFIMTVAPPMFGTYLLMKATAEAAKEARKHPAPLMPPEAPTAETEFKP